MNRRSTGSSSIGARCRGDLHATILHAPGIDHERLTPKFQSLDNRLTGVLPAKVVKDLFA